MRPIGIPLIGGLGNQLFQVAAGLVIHRETNREVEFLNSLLSGSRLGRVTPRKLAVQGLIDHKIRYDLGKISLIRMGIQSGFDRNIWIHEKINSVSDIQKISAMTKVVSGYFQSRALVDASKHEFLSLVSKSARFKALLNGEQENMIAVHVRLGDKLSMKDQKFYGRTNPDYYLFGVGKLIEQSSYKRIAVVSDEPNKADALLSGPLSNFGVPVEFVAGHSEIDDLSVLAKSRGVVMSCSSFSWWGSWFASLREPANVVVPVPWLKEKSAVDSRMNYPAWQEISKYSQGFSS